MKNLCEVCKINEATILCDYQMGSGIVTSKDFKELTHTCDKRLCSNCAIRLWADCDVCPEHAEVIRKKLLSLSK